MIEHSTVIVPECEYPDKFVDELYPEPTYTMIGTGCYAKVLLDTERPTEVLKVVSGGDNGYLSWLEIIQQLGNNNPYLPRIYDITCYRWDADHDGYNPIWGRARTTPGLGPGDRWVIRMERLNKVQVGKRSEWKRHATMYGYKLEDIVRRRRPIPDMRNKDREEMLYMLRICYEGNRTGFDLHDANYMIRKGGQVVITDPFA